MEHDADQLSSPCGRLAFSLVELLTVVAIMAVLSVFAGPSLMQVMRGGRLSLSSDIISGVLDQARLSSLSRQRPVEVRFYAYSDPGLPGKPGGVHALQCFVVSDGGSLLPLGPAKALADRAVITTNPVLTTLWSLPPTSPLIPIPRAGTAYECRSFRFLPDGGTSLAASGSSTPWSLTILSASEDLAGAIKPPKNFATLVIDPISGTFRTFRPSLN